MDYGARHYAPWLGRFISPDTIVPEPGSPQSLNRYAYANNSPLRYTDPTGMFSEDEIMGYLGVDSWDAVLALFGEGGRYAGLWGWLEVLRRAEIGSTFGIYAATGAQIFYGRFAQSDAGYLFLEGEYLYPPQGWVYDANGRPYYFKADPQAHLPPEAAAWLGAAGGYYVNASSIAAHAQYLHLKFDSTRVDWTSVGLGVASLGQDAGVALGVAGLGTGNPALITGGIALVGLGTGAEATSVTYTFAQYQAGKASGMDLTVSVSTALFGLIPGPIGIFSSMAGIIWDLHYGVSITP